MQNTLEQMAWFLSYRREFLKKKKKEKKERLGRRKGERGEERSPQGLEFPG